MNAVSNTASLRSIKFLYFVTRVLFWLSILFSVIIFSVLIYGAFGNDIGVRVSISSGDMIIQETIDYSDELISVVASDPANDSLANALNSNDFFLVMANANKNFANLGMSKEPEYLVFNQLPISSKLIILTYLVLMMSLTILSIWYFKRFMLLNIDGNHFQKETIKNLRLLSYSILLVWVVNFLFEIIISSIWGKNGFINSLDDLSIIVDVPSISLLLFALVLRVLSHVFMYGVELKEESKLTI
ncbi:MAG: DUF2975 domain-containing protein [Bacteroidetes bacterium]|nr:DUF2975 domain-containing protein [Bacteroidota bacterium]MDF1866795.1 DUF2975 domain-containing protein [Saprospiraceae bacterium]